MGLTERYSIHTGHQWAANIYRISLECPSVGTTTLLVLKRSSTKLKFNISFFHQTNFAFNCTQVPGTGCT